MPETHPGRRRLNARLPQWKGARIGLLGGSFNPAHEGHLVISQIALRMLDLDCIWWLVSPQNPLKSGDDMAPLAAREAWARMAAQDPRIIVTSIETDLGTRYTADTLTALRRHFPGVRFVWLMGADNLEQMSRWQNWRRIFETVPIAIFARPTYSLRALAAQAARRYSRYRRYLPEARRLADSKPPAWVFFVSRLMPISATQLRARAPHFATSQSQLQSSSQSQFQRLSPKIQILRGAPSIQPMKVDHP